MRDDYVLEKQQDTADENKTSKVQRELLVRRCDRRVLLVVLDA